MKTRSCGQEPPQLSFVDLFCGAGGLSLGFLRAGFRCLQAIDHDEAAVSTYRKNFENHIETAEISESTALKSATVIIGGPPCQGFSSAGLRRENDKRNTLVRVFANLVVQQKPCAFVFENVEGFLTADNGNRVIDLLEPTVSAGYRIHLRKINAANYGIPQHRKRAIAIGGFGWDPTFPAPTHTAYGAPGALSETRLLPLCPTFGDALYGLPYPKSGPPGIPTGHYTRGISDLDADRIALLEQGQSMKDLPEHLWHESYRRRANRRVKDGTPTEKRGGAPYGLRRLHLNQPSKAITSGALTEFVHPTEDRFLTLRECARIQTFPDEFEFQGTLGQIALQIGNAVPPKLAEIIARQLYKDLLLCTENLQREKSDSGTLLSFVPTTGSGMSPALQQVNDRVAKMFCSVKSTSVVKEQLALWP